MEGAQYEIHPNQSALQGREVLHHLQAGGRPLIGTRNAAYPAEELQITPKSIKTLFDWPDVEEDIPIEVMQMKDSRMCPMNEYKNQLIELHPGWEISYRGEGILPLMYEGGMFFVEQAYIAAAEKTEGYTSYHASENIDGEPLLIVGDGLITTAIVKPMAKKEGYAIRDYLERMTNFTVFGWPDEEKPEKAAGQLNGQMNMDEMLEEEDDEHEYAGSNPHHE